MGYFWITVLLWNLPLSFAHSLSCKDEEYTWPYPFTSNRCCNKCKPGEFMTERCRDGSTVTSCETCSEKMYTEGYNTLTRCDACDTCGKNETPTKHCTTKQNTVCECKPGYRRPDKGSECVEDRREATATTEPQWPSTISKPTPKGNNKSHVPDAVLLPVVLTVCVCILLFIIITKLKKLERFVCCVIDDSTSLKDTQSTEDEALPIQEVCSHLQEPWEKDGLESIISVNSCTHTHS